MQGTHTFLKHEKYKQHIFLQALTSMKIYTLKRQQHLDISLEKAWDFFSSPLNLAKLTPEYMNFEVLSNDANEAIYAGKIIEYKVHPVLNIPMQWVTEITHVEKNAFFVDEQRFGPYAFWHHKHIFDQQKNGVLMTDLVHYALPFGILGRIAHNLFVRKQLHSIFEFREHVLPALLHTQSNA